MTKMKKLPAIGKCFDHLGGRLAPILFARLLEMEWITPQEGKKTVFEVTDKGKKKFKEVVDWYVHTKIVDLNDEKRRKGKNPEAYLTLCPC